MTIRLFHLFITAVFFLSSSPLQAQQIGSVECTATLMHIMLEPGLEIEEVHCDLSDYSASYLLTDLPDSFKETYFVALQSGTLVVKFDGVDVKAKSISFEGSEQWSVSLIPESEQQRKLSKDSGFPDVNSVLVVYITAREDASLNDPMTVTSSFTPALISDMMFGTDGDSITMASQFNACSHGKSIMQAQTGANIVGGVVSVDIDVDQKLETMSLGTLRNMAIGPVKELIGNTTFAATNFILFAIPGGVLGPIASAGGPQISQYKGDWIGSLSGNLHEVGHNMRLNHSGVGTDKYADTSGMMGYSGLNTNGPLKCFNSAKNSQLEWLKDKEFVTTVAPSMWAAQLVGLTDYPNAQSNQYAVITIDGASDSTKVLYVGFNRKEEFNSGTGKFANKVTLHEVSPRGHLSWVLAGLGEGDEYTVSDFGGPGIDFSLIVDEINLDAANGVEYAKIRLNAVPPESNQLCLPIKTSNSGFSIICL